MVVKFEWEEVLFVRAQRAAFLKLVLEKFVLSTVIHSFELTARLRLRFDMYVSVH